MSSVEVTVRLTRREVDALLRYGFASEFIDVRLPQAWHTAEMKVVQAVTNATPPTTGDDR